MTVDFKTGSTRKNIHHFCIKLPNVPYIGLQIVYFFMPRKSFVTLNFLFEVFLSQHVCQQLRFLKVEMLSHSSFNSFTVVACVLYRLYTFPPNVSTLCLLFLQILYIFLFSTFVKQPYRVEFNREMS
jgi:hypothetical protein